MKGGLLMLAAPKGKPSAPAAEKPTPEADESEGSEKELFRLAVQAIKDGDDEGAADALEAAVKACVGKAEDGGYEPPSAA